MGRVSRYKKIKAVDPFSKRRIQEDEGKDLPPGEHEERTGHVSRKRRRLWAQEALGNEEYVQQLEGQPLSKTKEPNDKFEAKQPGESMKEFKRRLKRQTRSILIRDAKQSSSTSQKRKKFLDEKKRTQKEKKRTRMHPDKDKTIVFELGGTSEFPETEKLQFGETADRPPDLSVHPKRKAHKGDTPTKKAKFEGVPPASGAGTLAQRRQIEALRASVMEKYKHLRAKRRSEHPTEIVL